MSEKIELIPAAELPVAESDDVEALVIEGGELKRKEVGGGSSGPSIVHVKVTTTDGETFTSNYNYDELSAIVYKGDSLVYATIHDTRYGDETSHMHSYYYYAFEANPDVEELRFICPYNDWDWSIAIGYGNTVRVHY